MTSSTFGPTTRTVGTGEDSLAYDVHGDLGAVTESRPALVLFGYPMDASGFALLAGHIDDRPVVTFDPRGTGRNVPGTSDLRPEQHAEDLFRVIDALDCGPVDTFGSSGGGVTALAHAARYPEQVRRVVAHEPATAIGLPDADQVLAVTRDIKQTYLDSGDGPAMAKFIAFVMHDGEVGPDYLDGDAPDPAMFGMSGDDDGSRDNPLMRNMPASLEFAVDTDALRPLGDRIVLGVGAESGAAMPARAARAIAAQLGVEPVEFPSHHAGFTNQEGMPGEPERFAARLVEVLDR